MLQDMQEYFVINLGAKPKWNKIQRTLLTLLTAVSSKPIKACALIWPNTATTVETLLLANGFRNKKNFRNIGV